MTRRGVARTISVNIRYAHLPETARAIEDPSGTRARMAAGGQVMPRPSTSVRPTASADRAAETKASHEVMELVRVSPELDHLAMRLRDAGTSWREVKAAIDAAIKRDLPDC